MSPKVRKIILIIGCALLVIQLPWFFVVQAMVTKSRVKTTATVIGIVSEDAGCTGDTAARADSTCDHSARQYPVYAYTDASGHRHEQDDRFFGEYKQNNPLRGLFWKDVGDTVTAYYSKDKPQQVLFMAGPLAYTAWLIPLYSALTLFGGMGIIYAIQKLKKYSR